MILALYILNKKIQYTETKIEITILENKILSIQES